MLTTLLKQFGLGKAVAEPAFHRRTINLSGNRISFAMPENFSRDFPAEDMIESVDLDKAADISDYHGVTLLRRFWDFKTDGFFKKNLGTLVMVLSVKKVPEGCRKNLAHPLEFVQVLQDALREYYTGYNETVAEEFRYSYSESYNEFGELMFNRHRWIEFTKLRNDGREKALSYAIPVTPLYYFVVEFIVLPADSFSMRSFMLNRANKVIDGIMDTFDISYISNNSVIESIKQNENLKLEHIMEENARKAGLPEYVPE